MSGATVIVIGVAEFGSLVAAAPTDSVGNTYTGLTDHGGGTGCKLFYTCGPTTNNSMTFTFPSGTGASNTIFVAGWSGTATSNCFEAGTDQGGTVGVNSVIVATAATIGDLILDQGCSSSDALTPNTFTPSTFTVINQADSSSITDGAQAWVGAGDTNPITMTWTQSNSGTYSASAIFKIAPSFTYPPALINAPQVFR